MDDAHRAWIALVQTPGLGAKRLAALARAIAGERRSAGDLLHAPASEFERLGLSASVAERVADRLQEQHELPAPRAGVQIITPDDDNYPAHRLANEPPLPVVLYCVGNASLLRAPSVAIAGSRHAGPTALGFARSLAGTLARAGWNVVSGKAAGVDQAAHDSTLAAGGTTTAVLAEGMNALMREGALGAIDLDATLLVSQFAPDARWTKFNAMERNATIAALAEAVVVVAAGARGGSWSQGELCLKVGKPLYVPAFPPGVAEGNELLIRRGAIAVDPSAPDSVLGQLELDPEPRSRATLFE